MDPSPSPIAGQWYSGHAPSLPRSVDGYLDAAKAGVRAPAGKIVGVIAPHAGHKYSGPVAAYAFEAVRGLEVETVTILCPSHFHDEGLLITSGHEAYTTPLGARAGDREAAAGLRAGLALTPRPPRHPAR